MRAVFSRTARQPDPALTYPNNSYGHGDIDAYRGLLDVLGLSSIEGLSPNQPSSLRIFPADGGLRLCADGCTEAHIDVAVYALDGRKVHAGQVEMQGGAEATFSTPSLAPGVYAVQASSSDARLAGSTLVRIN